MTVTDYSNTPNHTLCRHCGHRFGLHGWRDNPAGAWKCPGGDGKVPRRLRLGQRYMAVQHPDLDAFWAERTTCFDPA